MITRTGSACKLRPRIHLAHVPAGIDFRTLSKPHWSDYGAWLTGAVVFQRYTIHDITADDFVPLAKVYTDQFIPGNVRRPLLDALLGHSVLECDGTYRPPVGTRTGKCYHFRVGGPYRTAPIIPHPIRSPELMNRIAGYRTRERSAVADPTHTALRRWVERLEAVPASPGGDPVLDRIATGDRWFTVCEQGRVHTPATNLSRELRPFVRVGGEHMAAVDVACSQPLLLATLAGGKGGRGEGRASALPFVSYSSELRLNEHHCIQCDTFLADCLSGALYERFQSVWRVDRDAAKVGILSLIYAYPHKPFDPNCAAGFAELYPVTWEWIATRARSLPPGELARQMQRIEADLMIHGAAATFLKQHPRVPLLTCHDALLVPPNATSAAERIVCDAWRDRYGITPRVKVSPWTYTASVGLGEDF